MCPFGASSPGIMPSGTLAAPGTRFSADLDTGFYLAGANQIGVSGTLVLDTAGFNLDAVYLQTADPDAAPFGLCVAGGFGNPGDPARDNVIMILGYNSDTNGAIDPAEYRFHTIWESHWVPIATAYLEHYIEAVAPGGGGDTRPIFITVAKAATLDTSISLNFDDLYFNKTKIAFQLAKVTAGATLATSLFAYYIPLQVYNAATAFQVSPAIGGTPVLQVTASPNAHTVTIKGDMRDSGGAWISGQALVAEIHSYAALANENTNDQDAIRAQCQCHAANGLTVALGWSNAVHAKAPVQDGAGTVSYSWMYGPVGVHIDNQGNIKATNSYGLRIENQADSLGVNYAIWTGAGACLFGDATATLGFFGTAPVARQTKAGHNNWANLSDVVNALVSYGLFDAA